jgi:hypothetical protein
MDAGLYSFSRTEGLKHVMITCKVKIQPRIRDDPWYVLYKEIISNLVIQPPGLERAKSPPSKQK